MHLKRRAQHSLLGRASQQGGAPSDCAGQRGGCDSQGAARMGPKVKKACVCLAVVVERHEAHACEWEAGRGGLGAVSKGSGGGGQLRGAHAPVHARARPDAKEAIRRQSGDTQSGGNQAVSKRQSSGHQRISEHHPHMARARPDAACNAQPARHPVLPASPQACHAPRRPWRRGRHAGSRRGSTSAASGPLAAASRARDGRGWPAPRRRR